MDAGVPLPLHGFRPRTDDDSAVLRVTQVHAEIDGDQTGPIPIDHLQARLEGDGDFAILQMEATFCCPMSLGGLEVQVNAAGLRTLEVDGAYCVPSKRVMPEDREGYVLPEDLSWGDHRLAWSYAWNPPDDVQGVKLVAPSLLGLLACDAELDIPEGVRSLLLEGPAPAHVSVVLDGTELPMAADGPARVALPPGTSGPASMVIRFHEKATPIRRARWLS
jgi:hypothetical protein